MSITSQDVGTVGPPGGLDFEGFLQSGESQRVPRLCKDNGSTLFQDVAARKRATKTS